MNGSNSIQINEDQASVPLLPKSVQNEMSMTRGKLGCIVGGSSAAAFLVGAIIMYGTANSWHNPQPPQPPTPTPTVSPTPTPTVSPRYQAQENLRHAILSEFPSTPSNSDPNAQCDREHGPILFLQPRSPHVVIRHEFSPRHNQQTVQGDCNPGMNYTEFGPFVYAIEGEGDEDHYDYPTFILDERPANPSPSYTAAENKGMFTTESLVGMFENPKEWWGPVLPGILDDYQMSFVFAESNAKYGMNLLVDVTYQEQSEKYQMQIDYAALYTDDACPKDVWKCQLNFYGNIYEDKDRQYFRDFNSGDPFADHTEVQHRLDQFNALYKGQGEYACFSPQECVAAIQDLMKDLHNLVQVN